MLLANEVLIGITADASRFAGRKERGGLLLGFRRGPHLHVTDATYPMRWDLSTMFSFIRSPRGHQSVALQRWKASGEKMDWIGEWHSHPEARPTPSAIDLNNWRSLTSNRQAAMVFVIVGYDETWVGLSLPEQSRPRRFAEIERSVEGVAYGPPQTSK